MSDFSAAEVGDMLGWPASRVRGFARDGLIDATRRGRQWRFGFSDLVVLRTARALEADGLPAGRLKRALKSLKRLLPDGRPLSTLRLQALGDRLVVRDGELVWEAESGQLQLGFEAATPSVVARLHAPAEPAPVEADACERALQLEDEDPEAAAAAYREALAADPDLIDAHINLGRLLQDAGRTDQATEHYAAALALDQAHPIALFNMATVLEKSPEPDAAVPYYERAAAAALPDAHYNLALLYERLGDHRRALRELSAYRLLSS